MTTPRDLLIIAMDLTASRPLEQGDLSLALAGAELIDLLGAQAITLDGDRIVPSDRRAIADRGLDEAASSLARQLPYESVGDWLWAEAAACPRPIWQPSKRKGSSLVNAAAG